MTWTIGFLLVCIIALLVMVSELKNSVRTLERQSSRQTDLLIALITKAGLDPVTLD